MGQLGEVPPHRNCHENVGVQVQVNVTNSFADRVRQGVRAKSLTRVVTRRPKVCGCNP